MKQATNILSIFISLIGQFACARVTQPSEQISVPNVVASSPVQACQPTFDDGVSPTYIPNAPERTVVGHGQVLTGIVLSSLDCKPIVHAKLEFWPEYAGLGHPDSARATFYADENGRYRFECDQPEHIHMRISAEGYRTIGVNSYHPEEAAEGTFDIILEPE
jgi:protocatechuate 3,4-dioxygenase beta subunit